MPGLLYADDLILCGESEEDLRAMMGHFVKVYRYRCYSTDEAECSRKEESRRRVAGTIRFSG